LKPTDIKHLGEKCKDKGLFTFSIDQGNKNSMDKNLGSSSKPTIVFLEENLFSL
jgi:hypothetical protein